MQATAQVVHVVIFYLQTIHVKSPFGATWEMWGKIWNNDKQWI